MKKQSTWEKNIKRLLSHPNYKKISKIGNVNEGWFRLNYKKEEAIINSHDSWDAIEYICKTLLK
jgi:hypothetical protein